MFELLISILKLKEENTVNHNPTERSNSSSTMSSTAPIPTPRNINQQKIVVIL